MWPADTIPSAPVSPTNPTTTNKHTPLTHSLFPPIRPPPSLVKIPELSQACTEMAREMEKAGLIEEIVGDAMDAIDVSACLH